MDDKGLHASLAPLAHAFGWSSPAEALAAPAAPCSGAVLAWNESAWDATVLLARLTGRRPVQRPDNPLAIPSEVELIVGLAGDLDDRLIGYVLREGRPSAIGLVTGRDPPELRQRALATAIAGRSSPPALPRRIVLQPDWEVGVAEAGLFRILGKTAPADAVREALSAGDTLLTLAGHGDGIDGEVAGGLVLCPQDADFTALASHRRPLCRLTGQCYRLEIPVAGDRFRETTLHPAAIVTRALVWNSCVGWPARDGFIARDYGVGLRLAASPRIGAMITTERVIIAPREITEPLAAALLRGVPLGEAVAHHNASPEARRHGHRLLLFGDPRARIAPPLPRDRRPPLAAGTAHRGPRSHAHTPSMGDAGLRASLDVLLGGSPADAATRPAWDRLQRHMLSGTLEGFWARTARRIVPAGPPDDCPYCGLATTNHRLETTLPRPQCRIVRICPRCEMISDRPVNGAPNVSIGTGEARLEDPNLPGFWRASLILRHRWPLASTAQPWPTDRNGRLARSMPWRRADPAAPAMVAVLLHGERTLAIYARAVPAERHDTGRDVSVDKRAETTKGCF